MSDIYHIGKIIAIEGLIGVGKSTLSSKLYHMFPESYKIYEEKTNEKFLQLFYSNPEKYAFSLQWGMLKMRLYQLKLSQHNSSHICISNHTYSDELYNKHKNKRDFYLWDRSMIGDYVFALLNHLMGRLTIEEMEVYEEEFGSSIINIKNVPFLKNIDLFLFLNDEPSNCKYRVENIRLNKSESSIPLSYYESLDDIYFFLIRKLYETNSNIIVKTWKDYDDIKEINNLFLSLKENKITRPLYKISNLSDLNEKTDKIYNNKEEIIEDYNKIKKNDATDLLKYKNVYIPYNIMIINPLKKNMIITLCKKYGVIFYENEYKRLVLWYLSKSINIHLYDKNEVSY